MYLCHVLNVNSSVTKITHLGGYTVNHTGDNYPWNYLYYLNAIMTKPYVRIVNIVFISHVLNVDSSDVNKHTLGHTLIITEAKIIQDVNITYNYTDKYKYYLNVKMTKPRVRNVSKMFISHVLNVNSSVVNKLILGYIVKFTMVKIIIHENIVYNHTKKDRYYNNVKMIKPHVWNVSIVFIYHVLNVYSSKNHLILGYIVKSTMEKIIIYVNIVYNYTEKDGYYLNVKITKLHVWNVSIVFISYVLNVNSSVVNKPILGYIAKITMAKIIIHVNVVYNYTEKDGYYLYVKMIKPHVWNVIIVFISYVLYVNTSDINKLILDYILFITQEKFIIYINKAYNYTGKYVPLLSVIMTKPHAWIVINHEKTLNMQIINVRYIIIAYLLARL